MNNSYLFSHDDPIKSCRLVSFFCFFSHPESSPASHFVSSGNSGALEVPRGMDDEKPMRVQETDKKEGRDDHIAAESRGGGHQD